MSIRFHRSIKIAKGVRLNISKSGLGLSVGPRGAKLSMNSKGVYSSLGIPGTGLSYRQKIGGNTAIKTNRHNSESKTITRTFRAHIDIDEETGAENITFFEGDKQVYDDSIIRKIKRDSQFKQSLDKERSEVLNRVNKKSSVILSIHRSAESFPDWERIYSDFKAAKPEQYKKEQFLEDKPTIEDCRHSLRMQALKDIKALFFRQRKIRSYIENRLQSAYEESVREWNMSKQEFDAKQEAIEKQQNAFFIEEFQEWKTSVEQIFHPTKQFIEQRIDDLFAAVQLPIEFSVGFEVALDCSIIALDLDLPEIEDFPTKYATQLASGKISIKEKKAKDLFQEYFISVTGLAIYFASLAYTVSPLIKTVLISGYTQRIDKASGNVEDEYVYSVKFVDSQFRRLNFEQLDPTIAIKEFEHRLNVNKNNQLGVIEPFTL